MRTTRFRLAALQAAAAAMVLVIMPVLAHAQVFDSVIDGVFSVGGGVSCAASGVVPIGGSQLETRCDAAGTNLAGASGGSATAITSESSPSADRLFEQELGHLNVFISGDYEHFQKRDTEFEPSYKTAVWRGAVGADYLMGSTTLGGAIRYVRDNGKFGGVSDPEFRTNSYGVVLYATAVPSESSFVSGSVGYMRQNFDIERAVFFDDDNDGLDTFQGQNRGTPRGNQYQGQVNAGYDFHMDTVTIGPIVGVNYLYDAVDDYSEHGNTGLELEYSELNQQSLTSRVGAHGSIAISTSFGVIVPQVTGEYVHEFMDRQRKIDFRFAEDANQTRFSFQNDDPDRDYFEVGAGVVLQLANGVAPFVSFRTLLGYNQFASRQVTAGARFEF